MSTSAKRIQAELGISTQDAKALKSAIDSASSNRGVEQAMETANKLLEGHGVEAIRGASPRYSSFFGEIVALYVNMGDTYNATVVYDVAKEQFYVTTYGDWVEWAMSRRTDKVEIW